MNDNDIIKSLRCCYDSTQLCSVCSYYKLDSGCVKRLCKDAYKLINRLQSENIKLEIKNQSLKGNVDSLKMQRRKLKRR